MKVRNDFVTNSSSSSFIIEKGQLPYGKLLKVLLEIANKEYGWFKGCGDSKPYKWEDVEKDCVAGRYHITEGTPENPYHTWEQEEGNNGYTNHYIIDNNGCVRYDWMVIEEVLAKYGVRWECGDCD